MTLCEQPVFVYKQVSPLRCYTHGDMAHTEVTRMDEKTIARGDEAVTTEQTHPATQWLPERIRKKIYVNDAGCWIWTGTRYRTGYGQVSFNGKHWRAHRLTMLLSGKAPAPAGMDTDHLCRNRACCNPGHMEVVTRSENTLRGASPEAQRRRHRAVTHCPQGHEYSSENTIRARRVEGHMSRSCRACKNESNRRRKLKRKLRIRSLATDGGTGDGE